MLEDWEHPTLLYKVADAIGNNRLFSPIYTGYIKTLGLKGNEAVLDFGSGSGSEARHLAERLQNGGRLVCADTSRYWTGVAKRRMQQYANVEFHTAPLEQVHLDGNSFDIVYVNYALHEVRREIREGIVRELYRLLKPGGRLFIREPQREYDGIPVAEIRSLTRGAGFREEVSFQKGKKFRGIYVK